MNYVHVEDVVEAMFLCGKINLALGNTYNVSQNIKIEKILDKQGNLVQKNKNPGLIWVLQGKRYSLPRSSELVAKLGQVDTNGSIIAQKQILNNYAGIVKFSKACLLYTSPSPRDRG